MNKSITSSSPLMDNRTENSIDKPMAIAASVIMAVVGIVVFMGMPVIVGALIDGYGLTAPEAGYLTSMDLVGVVFASLLVSILLPKVNRRHFLLVGLLVAAFFNGVTALVHDYSSLLAIRLFAGFGSGIVYAVGIALLAGTSKIGRNFSILLFAQVSVSGFGLFFIPKLASNLGAEAIFSVVALEFLLTIFLLSYIPIAGPEKMVKNNLLSDDSTGKLSPWLCLIAVFFFYISIGSFWAYCERLGITAGLTGDSIGSYLSVGNLFSLLGCGMAYWLSERYGQARPLLLAYVCICSAFLLLSGELTELTYMFGLFVFFLFWNFIDIFQLGTLSEIDHSGRYVALVPAFQGIGSAVGPGGAAWLLDNGLGLSNIMVFDSVTTVIALGCFTVVFSLRAINKSRIPVASATR